MSRVPRAWRRPEVEHRRRHRASTYTQRLVSCIALICLQALVVIAGPGLAAAQTPSPRIALVVGNGSYTARPIPTAPNDAGLVAQTLTAAGFDVTGARDLDGDALHRIVRDFIDHAAHLGPDGIAYVYFAGLGVQYGGENYFLPIDASLARETDVPLQAFRLSDLTRALASLPIQARVVVLDGAYRNDFPAREKLAGGLALVEPEAGTVLALNAAPDTVGPDTTGAYGVYAQAVSETMREPGVPVAAVFDRIRLKVNQDTQGADVPWSESKLTTAFTFLEPVAGAPAPQATAIPAAELQKRPLRDFTPADAYNAAIARDDFTGYRDYLETFPKSPYARRVRVLLAARREALTWRRTVAYATPDAYWSYLRRYPRGLHASEARDRLASLAAPLLPPPDFAPVEYDVPPPPEPEIVIVDRPVVVFAEPDEAPPPPPPLFLLPPPVEVVDVLPPPEPAVGPVFLPIPVPIPIPFGRSAYGPGELRPPRGIPGGYARPQPFISTPAGGLQPRPPRNDQPAPPPNAQRLPPASGQASPALPPSVASPSPTPGVAPVISNAPRPVPSSVAPGSGVPALRPLPGQGGVAARPQAEDPHRLPLPSGTSPLRPGSSPAVSLPGGTAKGSPSTTTGARPAPLAAPVPSGTPPPAPVAGPQKALPAVPAIAARPRLNPKAAPSLSAPAVAGPAKVPATVQSPAQPLDQRKALQDQVRQQQEKANQNQLQQQRQQQEQARQQQMQQQRQVQERSRQQQLQEQRRQQDQTRQQQLLQQRQQQEQVRQQQLQRQRQQQEQARQQQLGQQRQQQEQARQQQLQQQRQQQEQARQQQIQLQHAQQEQARQQQLQQQRVQQEQARQQQIQQQRQQQLQQQHSQPRQDCGKPGQPACH